MKRRIFISHSTQDRELASAVVLLLTNGTDTVAEAIFCSSLPGHNIPVGEDFTAYLKNQLNDSDVMVALITSNYYSSTFCMYELGAAWALAKRVVPLLTPPLSFSDLDGLFAGKQAVLLPDEVSLDSFRDAVEPRTGSIARWNQAKRDFLRRWPSLIVRGARKPDGGGMYARSEDPDCQMALAAAIRQARKVRMAGIGLNILKNRAVLDDLIKRVRAGDCHLDLLLADRESPSVQERLIEEEILRPSNSEKLIEARSRTRLPAGIALSEFWDYLIGGGWPSNLRVGLFTHRPSYAFIIADQQYFFYPYGYATLGNLCPVQRFLGGTTEHEPMIRFLESQFLAITSDAPDARTVLSARSRSTLPAVSDLSPFAVFFIPLRERPFYHFGSSVLGYDIHSGERFPGLLAESHVGKARSFGFHLTVADALYFANRAEVRRAATEVAVLLRRIRPFRLTDLQVQLNSPRQGIVSIGCNDMTRSLEAIHFELVHRVYKRSLTSEHAVRSGDSSAHVYDRDALMIDRYKAPHILQSFIPHFTLAANMPTEAQRECHEMLQMKLDAAVPEHTTVVESLSIMTKRDNAWVIDEEIRLGG